MVQQLQPTTDDIFYPESDGKPLADNTLQFELITTIKYGLEVQFKDNPHVFIAGDLLWYPVVGQPKINQAPDVMVVFGRPKGHRRSYKTWEENNLNPQVTFEIASEGNTIKELEEKKRHFYQDHGIEEYYLYDPDRAKLKGWLRNHDKLEPIPQMQGWVSPRLEVTFELVEGELVLYYPGGERFATYLEMVEQKNVAQQQVEQERQRAQQEQQRAQKAEQALEEERNRMEALLEQLKAKGINPEEFDL